MSDKLRPPEWWPSAGGTFQFPTDGSLKKAVKALQSHLDELDNAVNDLHAEGLVSAQDIGDWDAGQALAGAAQKAHSDISLVYRRFLSELQATADLLVKIDSGHKGAESASAKTMHQVGSDLPHPPSTVPTQQTAPSMALPSEDEKWPSSMAHTRSSPGAGPSATRRATTT